MVLFRPSRGSGRLISGVLALFWFWLGVVYHLIHFRVINPAARFFGILFIVEGTLFAIFGTALNRFESVPQED